MSTQDSRQIADHHIDVAYPALMTFGDQVVRAGLNLVGLTEAATACVLNLGDLMEAALN